MARSQKRKIFSKKKNLSGSITRWLSGLALGVAVCVGISLAHQAFEDPLAMVGLIVPQSKLTPKETWERYGPYFEKYATRDLHAPFLAALAQSTSDGNFLASPRWTIRFARGPFELLKPDNKNVGIMQFTQTQFKKSLEFCVKSGSVERERPWYQVDGCWFNRFSTRLSAANSIEQASAYIQATIDSRVHEPGVKASVGEIETFSALLHLCGITSALNWLEHEREIPNKIPNCRRGSNQVGLEKIENLQRNFEQFLADDNLVRK